MPLDNVTMEVKTKRKGNVNLKKCIFKHVKRKVIGIKREEKKQRFRQGRESAWCQH